MGITKRTGECESRWLLHYEGPCQGMYPLHGRVEPFPFVAASFSVRIPQRGLAQHQVRDPKLAPRRISYMMSVPSTCLYHYNPVITKDTRTRTTRRIPATRARNATSTPHRTREKTQNKASIFRIELRVPVGSGGPRAGADRRAGGPWLWRDEARCFSTEDLNRSLGGLIQGYLGGLAHPRIRVFLA